MPTGVSVLVEVENASNAAFTGGCGSRRTAASRRPTRAWKAVWRAVVAVPEVSGGVVWCRADYRHRNGFGAPKDRFTAGKGDAGSKAPGVSVLAGANEGSVEL